MNTFNPFLTTDVTVTETDLTRVDSSWRSFVGFFPYYRMYYVVAGSAKIFMHDQTLELLPDHVYFIPAYSITNAECAEIMEHYWIHFNLDITTINYLSIYKPILSINAQPQDKEIFKLILQNFNEKEKNPHIKTLACTSLTKYLLSRFLPSGNLSPKLAAFVPVLQYIDKNLFSDITNEDLSKIMCLNKTYFSNLFTKQFGISPKQYILQKRIGAAASMLIETNKSIKEIAFHFGYDNEIYFNRIFHKITGLSPGKYRKNFHNQTQP